MSNRGVLVAKYHKLLSFSWILMFQIWQKNIQKSHISNFWRIRNEMKHILLHNFFLGSVHKYSGGRGWANQEGVILWFKKGGIKEK